jgi:dihydroxyacetone kinase-like predicted kinase
VTGVVACAAGDGIARLFGDEGAVVIDSGPARRASTGQFIEAIQQVHALGVRGVVVLPNDSDTELAAAAAARAVADDGIDAVVVRARTAVQGIAALAVYEPTATPQANVLAMQSAASATRHGAVTIANREGLTSGGPCKPGDVLGVVDGDIVLVGTDQLVIAREVVHRLLASGGELVTVLVGADAPDGIVGAIAAEAREEHRGVELNPLDGGQPVYSVLIGVE